MRAADLHTHTRFSYDREESLDRVCRAAIDAGLSTLAVTNHYDADCISAGYYPPYDFAADDADIRAAKERYRDRLRILRGLEVGQPHLLPAGEISALCRVHGITWVIGSVHNLPGAQDFYYLDYTKMTDAHISALFSRYLSEYAAMVQCDGIHAAAHLTYPLRYLSACGRLGDAAAFLRPYRDRIAALLSDMIRRDVILEVNTSGCRKSLGTPLPDFDLIALYRDLGGRRVSCGFDAHRAADIGSHIAEVSQRLTDMGLTVVDGSEP